MLLDRGEGDHVQVGDRYRLLGRALVMEGWNPDAMGTTDDAVCVVDRHEDIQTLHTRCRLVGQPKEVGQFAVLMQEGL